MRDGKTMVTDGPFAETKEQLGGYVLVEAKDLDEAIAIAARIPSSKYGSTEVRPVRKINMLPAEKEAAKGIAMKYMLTGGEMRGESESIDAEEMNRRIRFHQQKLDELLRARLRGGRSGLINVSVGLGRAVARRSP